MKDLRMTGRTTRMLQEVVEAARSGKHPSILVVAANNRHAAALRSRLPKELVHVSMSDGLKPIQVKPIGSVFNDINWTTMQDAHAVERTVFFDHFALESFFGEVFKEMHRYDREELC